MSQRLSVMNKSAYRKQYLLKRKMLSASDLDAKNRRLLSHFKTLVKNREFTYVHCFLPIIKNKEVNTWLLIAYLEALGAQVVVSKSDLHTPTLTHYVLDKSLLVMNRWGIPEPKGGVRVEARDLDMILVPLIVCDKQGHRIGYGKGYYDRFLSDCREDSLKVGLSLSPPLDAIPFVESQDVALDYCITPLGAYAFI